jgi:hypothetical protein
MTHFWAMVRLQKMYMALLLIASTFMLLWGLAGFFEYVTEIKPFIALQNDAYPDGVQFVHWLLISLTGGTFLTGYFRRWRWTPIVMVCLFSNLAVLCTIQTFDFMSEQWSFSAYATEMISYAVHSVFLLTASLSKTHFKTV